MYEEDIYNELMETIARKIKAEKRDKKINDILDEPYNENLLKELENDESNAISTGGIYDNNIEAKRIYQNLIKKHLKQKQ